MAADVTIAAKAALASVELPPFNNMVAACCAAESPSAAIIGKIVFCQTLFCCAVTVT